MFYYYHYYENLTKSYTSIQHPYEDSKSVSVCLSVCPSVHLSVCPHPEKRNHHSFVNMSPTLVIDTSMERSSRVLHHGNPKI